MTGHYYSECFGMVSETGITFLIVCACVCFSFYCLQFLALHFWGVQKQEEGYIPHFQWQVQPENCITHAQLLPCRGSSVQPVAALSTVDAGQCLCTWTSLSWKGQKELDVKTKQCSACVGHSQSWVCGAASLSGSGTAAEWLWRLRTDLCTTVSFTSTLCLGHSTLILKKKNPKTILL